jgi:hypothetical protein
MSRVLLLKLDERQASRACDEQGIAISVCETLDSGGVRLVCVSADGAARMRHKLRAKLIEGPVQRSRVFSKGMQPFASGKPADPPRPRSASGATAMKG